MQGVELRPAGDPEDDRWRLLQAVTSFLRNASTVQPLLIVLEDLHWADRGTLDLLLHVARNLQGARLLIVGTYRDVEVDRAHPLSGDAGRAAAHRAASAASRCAASPSTKCTACIRRSAARRCRWAQAEAVHRQTEGNPLFVQEVLRYLVEEGLRRARGRPLRARTRATPVDGIPEGLRDVVGKRLSRLSAGVQPPALRSPPSSAATSTSTRCEAWPALRGRAAVAAIEEAVRVGVLEERSLPGAVRYRFAHAFFRQTLYEEMIAPRRLRLHQEVARALEAQYARAATSTRPSWRSTSPSPPTAPTWRRRCVRRAGGAARDERSSPTARPHATWSAASPSRRCSTRTTRRAAATCCSRWARRSLPAGDP